jgi:hypothetical protein
MSELKPLADFPAGISGVKTMADGSPRITLDCPESVNEQLSRLAMMQVDSRYLHVVIYDADEFEKALKAGK